MHSVHEQLISEALKELEYDSEVIGVLLQGSMARGDGYPTSDLDLFILLRDGCRRPFVAFEEQSILIEHHASDREYATAKIRANPMLAYGFTDGRILRDDSGGLAELSRVAHEVIDSYKTPPSEREGILYWLRSSRIKINAAKDAGDLLKASFVVATTSWKILEGMWAVNDLPMPPSGTVLAHRKDLTQVPDNWDELFEGLFLDDTLGRIHASLTIIDWLLDIRNAK